MRVGGSPSAKTDGCHGKRVTFSPSQCHRGAGRAIPVIGAVMIRRNGYNAGLWDWHSIYGNSLRDAGQMTGPWFPHL